MRRLISLMFIAALLSVAFSLPAQVMCDKSQLCPSGVSVPTFVQYAYAQYAGTGGTAMNLASSNSYAIAFPSNLGASHYVVCVLDQSASTSSQTVTFTPSLTATALSGNPFSTDLTTSVWTAPTGSGGANTNVAWAWTTTSIYDSGPCAEYSNVNSTTPIDTGASAICHSNTVTSASVTCNVTTTGTNETIITYCTLNVAGSVMQAGSGETVRVGYPVNTSISNGALLEEMAASTAGSYTTGCHTTSAATGGGVVSFAFNHS